mmetsp:Transcript_15005/g.36747  ORF Transcript_15005/g.36747 Transcript_15005/m.36747 type:complete len:279 (-) Transcript_15005:68-904(-)
MLPSPPPELTKSPFLSRAGGIDDKSPNYLRPVARLNEYNNEDTASHLSLPSVATNQDTPVLTSASSIRVSQILMCTSMADIECPNSNTLRSQSLMSTVSRTWSSVSDGTKKSKDSTSSKRMKKKMMRAKMLPRMQSVNRSHHIEQHRNVVDEGSELNSPLKSTFEPLELKTDENEEQKNTSNAVYKPARGSLEQLRRERIKIAAGEKDTRKGASKSKRYYFGIIDILAHWNFVRKTEYVLKKSKTGRGGNKVGILPPKQYCERFREFVDSHIVAKPAI